MSDNRALAPVMTWTFVALMLTLAVVCTYLGNWQMSRLAEKDALINAVAARLTAEPVAVPAASEWPTLDVEALNFQLVELTGTFRHSQTVTVFTSLGSAKGAASGPGYWVVTPFVLTSGGTVFVNRGFIPERFQEAAVHDGENDNLPVTISGVLRPSEHAGLATPAADTSNRVEWVRDIDRLAAMVDPALAPYAPFYVDLPAGPPGELPQGGETVIEFPNNHLGYAWTWYGFAVVAVVMLGFWLFRQRAGAKD